MEVVDEIMLSIFSIINWKYVAIYVIAINIFGFIAMGWDKLKSQKNWWRTPEATLMSICAFGGGIGTITGMYIFRHKTKKPKFSVGMPIILVAEIVFIIYLVIRYIFIV